ncbi:peptidase M14 [Polaribacter pacificus]|uniref:Peptidase M14 n=1 Tax=Polaribacter pacificus TaxID=1775173 RepID=A0A917I295_9FLAO|nr:M14 family metallopeptidase [Polaribacter pacificus]GGH02474.1 peptidase M14 [Polaribacter pacificus]
MRKFLVLIAFFTASLSAQQIDLSYYLPQNISYNQQIPTPKSVIGHEVGEWHITHDKLAEYMKALAASSDRISIENRGTTYEGRPLLLLTITSPKNHQNLENIRKQHLALTENPNMDVSNLPIVVNQGFSIHGNEPSGSNAALAVAYYLAAGQGKEIEDMLDNTIILFDPSFNPDGLQRFAYWANTNKAKNINPDPNDREYSEVWPGGRTNHYWFDMNRDWLPVQLAESRARIETFHKWLPNILTDHHEMGTNSSFFFQPGIPSRTNPLTPQLNQDLTKEIGNYHAKAFDKLGSMYYSEESFDDFYYGKGSTFPDVNGSIGILFEQASSRGHAQESVNGIITFPFTVRNQFTAALSTLAAAQAMRVKILKYQQDFYKQAYKEGSKAKAIVFGDEKDAARTYHLAEILKRQHIKFNEVKSDFTSKGKTYKKGYSFIIPMDQKNNRLVKAMFQKTTKFTDSLFYDISAWTFPLAFNLDYEEEVSTSRIGKEVTNLTLPTGKVSKISNYGYLMPWNEYYSPKALNMILEKGIRAKVGLKQFKNENKKYDYGTIFIPVQNQSLNSGELYAFLNKVAKESYLDIFGTSTGLNDGVDLGSNNFSDISKKKIAVLVGSGISSSDAGEIWHLFDQRFDITVTKLDVSRVGRVNLSKYSTIIFPSGGGISKAGADDLKAWVRNGGVLIGYRGAVRWLSSNKFMNLEYVSSKSPNIPVSFENRSLLSGAQVVGGAIFNTKLDLSHPINFGYKNDELPMFRNSTTFIKANSRNYNNPIQYTANPLLAGYISKENLKVIGNTVPFQVQRSGRGRVIAFTDNTNFRAFWFGTNKLLMNAIYFADKM